jgi:hypothetical protein
MGAGKDQDQLLELLFRNSGKGPLPRSVCNITLAIQS